MPSLAVSGGWQLPHGEVHVDKTVTLANSQQQSEPVNSQVSLLRNGSSPSQNEMNPKMTMAPGNTWTQPVRDLGSEDQASHTQISDPQKLRDHKRLLFMPLSLGAICCAAIGNKLPCTSNILSTETLPRTFF